VETGGSQTEEARAGIGSEGKVVRLPRDWLGPRDELVPIDLSDEAPAVAGAAESWAVPLRERPDGPAVGKRELAGPVPASAEAFWSEHATVLHDAVCAPPAARGHAGADAGTPAEAVHDAGASASLHRVRRPVSRPGHARRPLSRTGLAVAAALMLSAVAIARLVPGPGSRDAAGHLLDAAASTQDYGLPGAAEPGGAAARSRSGTSVGQRPTTGGSALSSGVDEARASGGRRAWREVQRSSDRHRVAASGRRGHAGNGDSHRSGAAGGAAQRPIRDGRSRAAAATSADSTRPATGAASSATAGSADTDSTGSYEASSTRGSTVGEAATSSPPDWTGTPPAPDQNGLPLSGGPPPP